MSASRRTAVVVGGGPAGLMAAETLARGGVAVTVVDRMPSLGRKLLMAGRGGLNLTHSEAMPAFLARYADAEARLAPAIAAFSPDDLRRWSEDLGQSTFVGTSGRVFPAAMKASPLLRAWLRRLEAASVPVLLRHRWEGWLDDGRLAFESPDGAVALAPDATILALGGASWPRLGSDGAWVAPMAAAGLAIAPLRPANSGFVVEWSSVFAQKFGGQPVKNVALSIDGRTARGDVVVTANGLEGGAIYGLSAPLRDAIAANGHADLTIALRPDLDDGSIAAKLARRMPKQSLASVLRKTLHLAPVAIGLLHEAALIRATPLSAFSPGALVALINAVPIKLVGTAPLARAISTAGGVAFDELDSAFMVRRRPGTFVAGEMLDWESPTGGYLLQACFATGAAAGRGALAWLETRA